MINGQLNKCLLTSKRSNLTSDICFYHFLLFGHNFWDEKLQDEYSLLLSSYISSPWFVISLYGLGCNIVLQLGDLVKGINGGL